MAYSHADKMSGVHHNESDEKIRASFKSHAKAKSKALHKKSHHEGTKYLPVHPVHKGEKKEE